jgi:hypothetical protein
MNPISPLVMWLAIALGVSLLGNAALTHSYLGVRDERTEAQGERDQARFAATACSDATEALQEQAGKRLVENKAEVARAAANATARAAKAQREIQLPATRPNDDCGSAVDRATRWLAERGKP